MFQLTKQEFENLNVQIENTGNGMSSQFVMTYPSKTKQHNEQLTEIRERIAEHDVQVSELYDAMENLIDEKIAQLKWNDRVKIGFKIKK